MTPACFLAFRLREQESLTVEHSIFLIDGFAPSFATMQRYPCEIAGEIAPEPSDHPHGT
jgi:hypothetical protein